MQTPRRRRLPTSGILLLASCLCLGALACSRPIARARTHAAEPLDERELQARSRIQSRKCSGNWAYLPLPPGIAQYCYHKTEEVAVLAVAGSLELSAGLLIARHAEEGSAHPGAVLALAAFQDTWIVGISDMLIENDLARGRVYAPRDTLSDLLIAPFNLEVMKDPKLLIGLAGALAIGIGASIALSDDIPERPEGEKVNVFGYQASPWFGYPAGLAAFGGLFSHVAPAEEMLFRGVIQSRMAGAFGENAGWIGASAIFGLAHAPNALALETSEERKDYLTYGLPIISVLGSYMGYLYKDGDYSLASPTAFHFWYDFLLSAGLFALDPQNSLVSAKVGIEF